MIDGLKEQPAKMNLWAARARRSVPGGVSSNVRLPHAATFFDRGEGALLYDLDGKQYVDYLLGQGPAFLGHAHPVVTSAVAEATRRGMVFGAQHALEVEATEAVLEVLGWADQARLGVSGTESVQAALRVARGATGRRTCVRFAGHYHGWVDNVLLAPVPDGWGVASLGQHPQSLADWRVLPFNDVEAFDGLMSASGDEIAAVIMEPMMCNAGAIEPDAAFLARVREQCSRHRIVLVFDEVVTGFRLALGGAAAAYGVEPDLAVYGKAIAGGWPVSALAGRAELFAEVATGRLNLSGTFNASIMASAAVKAAIGVLRTGEPYAAVAEHGARLMELVASHRSEHFPIRVQGRDAAFHVSFGDETPVRNYADLQNLDLARYEVFARTLIRHGLWLSGRGIWYVSAAHGQRELDLVQERLAAAVAESCAGAPSNPVASEAPA